MIWKPVKGYEGYYEISDSGILRSVNRCAMRNSNRVFYGREICTKPDSSGYKKAMLRKFGTVGRFKISRLVAFHFIPNPNNKPFVNHKNGIKHDDRVENLEWCTQSENMQHWYDVLGHKPKGVGDPNKKGGHSYRAVKVAQYSKTGNLIRTYDYIGETEKYGFSHSGVSNVLRGKINSHGGFNWKRI